MSVNSIETEFHSTYPIKRRAATLKNWLVQFLQDEFFFAKSNGPFIGSEKEICGYSGWTMMLSIKRVLPK
jgi:hypothetical protein